MPQSKNRAKLKFEPISKCPGKRSLRPPGMAEVQKTQERFSATIVNEHFEDIFNDVSASAVILG